MRNALVVLVLCIGFGSGFIIPSRALEILNETQTVAEDNVANEKIKNESRFAVIPKHKFNDSKPTDLETNQNRIKDKELYEQNNGKPNNVNERSFIFINQKFKTPVVNQLYSTDLVKDTFKSLIEKDRNVNRNSARFPSNYIKPKNINLPVKIREKEPFFYFPTVIEFTHPDIVRQPGNNENINVAPEADKRVSDLPRAYLELLKPPLVRPVTEHLEPQKDVIKPQNKQPTSQNIPNYQFIKKPPQQTPHFTSDRQEFDLNPLVTFDAENYGYPSPYGQRSTSGFYSNKHEEFSTITNSNIKKLIKDNNEVSKLLDRYLKETLDGHATRASNKYKMVENKPNVPNVVCDYKDCVIKQGNEYMQNNLNVVNCKCSRRSNVQLRESKGYKLNTTTSLTTAEDVSNASSETTVTPKSMELSDYGELLTDESNLKTLFE